MDNSVDHTGEGEKKESVVNWPQDMLGYMGVSVTMNVSVTAMVQRIYWRKTEISNVNLGSTWLV